jgi:hypothetical protein
MTAIRTLTAGSALAAIVAVGVVTAPAATAKGLEVRASGSCSLGATWKLKAKQDNARIQTELEVDRNRVGQTWSVRLFDNGVLVASGTATTVAPSGSFTFRRIIANRAGNDTITAVATYAPTGEVCRAKVVYPG